MKNLVHVIYPDEYLASFIVEGEYTAEDILERVFAQWNHGSGCECEQFINSKKRSLSVNDIVCVNGTYYQCASFGWNEVTSDYVNKLEYEVSIHPRRSDGAWFVLHDIMWDWNKKKNTVVTR